MLSRPVVISAVLLSLSQSVSLQTPFQETHTSQTGPSPSLNTPQVLVRTVVQIKHITSHRTSSSSRRWLRSPGEWASHPAIVPFIQPSVDTGAQQSKCLHAQLKGAIVYSSTRPFHWSAVHFPAYKHWRGMDLLAAVSSSPCPLSAFSVGFVRCVTDQNNRLTVKLAAHSYNVRG